MYSSNSGFNKYDSEQSEHNAIMLSEESKCTAGVLLAINKSFLSEDKSFGKILVISYFFALLFFIFLTLFFNNSMLHEVQNKRK